MSNYGKCMLIKVTWMRWYVSDIIAINKLINTITDTSKYVPKIILKNPSVHAGRICGIGFISSLVVWPNTAKNNRSNAMSIVIWPVLVVGIFFLVLLCFMWFFWFGFGLLWGFSVSLEVFFLWFVLRGNVMVWARIRRKYRKEWNQIISTEF